MLINVAPTDTKLAFYFECDKAESTEDVNNRGIRLLNSLIFLSSLVDPLEDLAKHGPLRAPEYKALTGQQEGEEPLGPSVDAYNLRTGHAPDETGKKTLTDVAAEIRRVCYTLPSQRNPVTEEVVKEAIAIAKGALMMVWPMGLPDYDPAKELLDAEEDILEGKVEPQKYYSTETSCLFFAGSSLCSKGPAMSSIKCGANAVLKVIPSRSNTVVPRKADDEARAAMMSYMFKREKSLKEAELNTTEEVYTREWTNKNSLRNQLHGLSEIRH
ncbi:hypothetical protein GL50803_0015834 [Giardia duodenalis]|uniref:Uncharacterized protein n=1 Tax=Giardia intestinalis (strain ATCC 50803 / WB clone C6) TaxID=184922 RepID=A8BRK1_GIAIC|nr:hypothetical protein GL50803_0015834 [Giardia intestinalis]KAE8305991.1 hypothetical protein GL50803_0015834 [Giardia intestinalis]|eukprot:XP_001705285.1 Hypothetical protein GL50803_15834 [Giardia lamblia ATCC 50803]